MATEVILVDVNDNEKGTMEKLEVHQKGLLHRAFSVFIFNTKGEVLLQQRATGKYHSGGLWSNACCSHPGPGEHTLAAAERRLKEEMGLRCKLIPAFTFIYKVKLDHGLTEHELDHVFFGRSGSAPVIEKEEVENWKYVSIDGLVEDLKSNPGSYTEWLKLCFDKVRNTFRNDQIQQL